MPRVNFRCLCVNDCLDFDMKCSMIYSGVVHIDEYGDTTFIVELNDGEQVKCVQEWFVNYFRIIE